MFKKAVRRLGIVFSILAVFGAIALGSQKIVLASELDSDSIEPTELAELLYMKQYQDVDYTFQIFVFDSGGSTGRINLTTKRIYFNHTYKSHGPIQTNRVRGTYNGGTGYMYTYMFYYECN